MKKILVVIIMLSLILLAHNSQAKSVKWVYQGAIDTTTGLALQSHERLMLAASDSRGIFYYATYESAAAYMDIHVYKMTNVLDTSRNVTILDTVSNVSIYNQYYGLCTDTANNVYAGTYYTVGLPAGDSTIRKYDANGSLVTSFGTNGSLSPPMMAGLSFRPGAMTYVPGSNKLVVTGNSGAPDTTYTGRLVGLDANTGGGIDTSLGVTISNYTSTTPALRYIRGMAYNAANNNFLTLNSVGLLERWSGGTPSDLTGYIVETALQNYLSAYGTRLQLSFDSEYRQTFASVSSAVPERYYISVVDLDSGNETQRLTADSDSTAGPYGWCAGSCLIGGGNNKRLIAVDYYAGSKLHIYAPELPQISPTGPITLSIGMNRDLTAILGTEPYTWSINTISGSPGTLNVYAGNTVTFLSSDTGSCIVRCTDANGLYAEVTINVVPTSAPLFVEPVQASRSRLEE
jgi:hypothetical protein